MTFTAEQIKKNREYFEAKLSAEKQKIDVASAVKGDAPLNFILLDARTRDAFAAGHIQGAINIPLAELSDLMSQLPKDKEIVTYCWNKACQLSAQAALRLNEKGYFAREMNVGWVEWATDNLPNHKGAAHEKGARCDCSKL